MLSRPVKWEKEKSEYGPELRLFRVRFDWLINPRTGSSEQMTILEGPDSANVVAITPAREMVFVRQFRVGIGQYTLELPGGIIEQEEDKRTGAARELREETGYGGSDWTYLGKVASNPVFMDSYVHHFLLRHAQITSSQQLDSGEEVEVVLLQMEEVEKRWRQGGFLHPHTVTALQLFFQQQRNSF